MKLAKCVLLYLATAILMLHSIIPHHHHLNTNHVEICNHQDDTNLVSILENLFGGDLGENHLEVFKNEKPGNAKLLISYFLVSNSANQQLTQLFNIHENYYFLPTTLGKTLPYYSLTLSGRAPPTN